VIGQGRRGDVEFGPAFPPKGPPQRWSRPALRRY